jgi:hypothetical protein
MIVSVSWKFNLEECIGKEKYNSISYEDQVDIHDEFASKNNIPILIKLSDIFPEILRRKYALNSVLKDITVEHYLNDILLEKYGWEVERWTIYRNKL